MSFTEKIWEWDSLEESEKLRCLYSFGDALEFLSSSASKQIANLPGGCPSCEVWSTYGLRVDDFVNLLSAESEEDVRIVAKKLLEAFDLLTEEEAKCWDENVLTLEGWDKIRSLSSETLSKIEWDLLNTFRKDLNRAL